jgi:mRNA degradation ribonuclease J1/J2
MYAPCTADSRCRARWFRVSYLELLAARDGSCGHVLAEGGLVDPLGVEDDLEVVLGDRLRLDEDRVEVVSARVDLKIADAPLSS